MSIAIAWLLILLGGLILGIVFASTHKFAWTKVVLLSFVWMITFLQIGQFWIFLSAGILATFLTLIILGKLEPREQAAQQKNEEM